MQLAGHLHDTAPTFQPMVEEYQEELREFLKCTDVNWDQGTPLRSPAGYKPLVVRMNTSPQVTIANSNCTQVFWADKLKQIGSRLGIPVILAGLTTDHTRLVFLVSECYIIELFQWAQQNKGVIYTEHMETFTVPDQVTLNTRNGQTVSLRIATYGHTTRHAVARVQGEPEHALMVNVLSNLDQA